MKALIAVVGLIGVAVCLGGMGRQLHRTRAALASSRIETRALTQSLSTERAASSAVLQALDIERKSNAKLMERLAQAESDNGSFKAASSELRLHLRETKELLARAQSAAEAERKLHQMDHAEWVAKLEDASRQFDNRARPLETALGSARAQVDRANSSIVVLKAQQATLRHQIEDDERTRIPELHAKVKTLEDKIAGLVNDLGDAKASINKLNGQVQQLQGYQTSFNALVSIMSCGQEHFHTGSDIDAKRRRVRDYLLSIGVPGHWPNTDVDRAWEIAGVCCRGDWDDD